MPRPAQLGRTQASPAESNISLLPVSLAWLGVTMWGGETTDDSPEELWNLLPLGMEVPDRFRMGYFVGHKVPGNVDSLSARFQRNLSWGILEMYRNQSF